MNTTQPQFNGREEYLAWRAQWRTDYKALSQEIRDIKFALHHRRRADATEAVKARCKAIQARYMYGAGDCQSLDGVKFRLRQDATAMLVWRKLSKEKAQGQYMAAHTAKAA